MRYFLIILLCLNLICCQSQGKSQQTSELKPPFSNQGEQENYWAQEFFAKKYVKQNYSRFNGKVKEAGRRKLKYDKKFFNLNGVSNSLISIFKKGIIYPQLINGKANSEKINFDIDSLPVSQTFFHKIKNSNSFSISNLEELTFLSGSIKVKRFRFWLNEPNRINPQVYLFELTNKEAIKETTLEDFISNSKLTFFKAGWIII